jgi:hypothetical protein
MSRDDLDQLGLTVGLQTAIIPWSVRNAYARILCMPLARLLDPKLRVYWSTPASKIQGTCAAGGQTKRRHR